MDDDQHEVRVGPPMQAGTPAPTSDDPTAEGFYCGSPRKPGQVRQDLENDEPEKAWPWCRARAGRGTDHLGTGQCSRHGGSLQTVRTSIRLRLAELAPSAIQLQAQLLANPAIDPSVRFRVSQDILDRAGYPRRMEIDHDAGRQTLVERILDAQARAAALPPDDDDETDPA